MLEGQSMNMYGEVRRAIISVFCFRFQHLQFCFPAKHSFVTFSSGLSCDIKPFGHQWLTQQPRQMFLHIVKNHSLGPTNTWSHKCTNIRQYQVASSKFPQDSLEEITHISAQHQLPVVPRGLGGKEETTKWLVVRFGHSFTLGENEQQAANFHSSTSKNIILCTQSTPKPPNSSFIKFGSLNVQRN